MAKNGTMQAPHRRVLIQILAGMALIILTFSVSAQTRALAHSSVSQRKGHFIEFPVPNGSGAPFGITAAPCRQLLVTEQSAPNVETIPPFPISTMRLPNRANGAPLAYNAPDPH